MSGERTIARGVVASEGTAEGVLRRVNSVEDVLSMMEQDMSDAVVVTEHASVSSIVPILPHVRAVVCRGGGVTSHVAIVSRQFGLPCIVAADFTVPVDQQEGRRVAIGADGQVVAVCDEAAA